MRYKVKYSYTVPEWAEIEIDADDEELAGELAYAEFKQLYPEAIDIDLLGVEEID